MERVIGQVSEPARREADKLGKTRDECTEAIVSDLKTDVGHAHLSGQQQAFRGLQAKRAQELAGRNPCYLSEDAVKVKGAEYGDLSQRLQREVLTQLRPHCQDNPLYRPVV
jgi:hypothetical protein